MNSEHIEQVNFVNWLEYNYPDERFFAIPNGGKRSIKVAKELKAEGVKKGVPDMYFPRLKLWIEMKKVKGGSLSKDQKEWRDYLVDVCGDSWYCCKGFEEAKEVYLSCTDNS